MCSHLFLLNTQTRKRPYWATAIKAIYYPLRHANSFSQCSGWIEDSGRLWGSDNLDWGSSVVATKCLAWRWGEDKRVKGGVLIRPMASLQGSLQLLLAFALLFAPALIKASHRDFTCAQGSCVVSDCACNFGDNCEDGSDEEHCEKRRKKTIHG